MVLLKKYKKQSNMTEEEKALEKDYRIYCEIFNQQSDRELNLKYKKNYL